MEKVNYPENTLFYINQTYLTVKKNKKLIATILSSYISLKIQIHQKKILPYTLKKNEARMVRPKYDTSTGQCKGLYETVRFLVARGSPEEFFFLIMVMIKINQKFFILTTEGNPELFHGHII